MPDDKIPVARRARWFYLAAGAPIVVAFVATVIWLGPLPPKVVVMTTGTPGSAYDAFGQRYKKILARSGVELRLLPSTGSVDNLRRLNDPHSGVSVGFVQDGLTDEEQSPELMSLGTLFYEPLWFFYRGAKLSARFEGLHGKKLSIGPDGSGTRALALQLLALNGIDRNIAQLLPLSAEQSSQALLKGEIDAAFMVASWDTPAVRQLLASSEVKLVTFPRADAYVALYPFLTKLVLPTGVGNMVTNRPPTDVNLLAPKASLVVRKDLHPAIQYLLLEAALRVHSAPGIFHKAGQFPAPEAVDLPLSGDA
jgi:TRAP transporter TAXI family solute receptor